MPLIVVTPDALPYIDTVQSEEVLNDAKRLIEKECVNSTTDHHLLPAYKVSLIQPSDEKAIDLSRYDVLDAPTKGDLDSWRTTLQQAYASSEYLRGREVNLALLETYGKNAWLIGNSQLEDILRDIERDIDGIKTELEATEQERRTTQGNVAGEMQNLQDTWRQGVGRMIEAQAAGEKLRQEILERRRHGV